MTEAYLCIILGIVDHRWAVCDSRVHGMILPVCYSKVVMLAESGKALYSKGNDYRFVDSTYIHRSIHCPCIFVLYMVLFFVRPTYMTYIFSIT